MNKIFFFIICLVISCLPRGFAQSSYTLYDIVNAAKGQSLPSLQANNRKENRYWRYRTIMANYRPQLTLGGNLPNFDRSISLITLDDGTDAFRNRSQTSADLNLQISQTIAPTGGRIFVGSQVSRVDIFGDFSRTAYSANPLVVGFVQPLFNFNQLRWDQKIEPIRYDESLKQFNEDMERVAQQASELFFNLLLAQISLEIAQKNKTNNDTIYRIAEGRFQLGKIAENELLQLELNVVNAEQQMRQARLDMETANLALNTFIGQPQNEAIRLQVPDNIPEFTIDENLAIQQAKENRQQYLAFKRQKMEAERDVAEAKGESSLNANLSATFGLTQQANNFGGIYSDPRDQQRVLVNFTIPIVDWGRQKAAVRTALANQDLVNNTVAQEEINFEQEIYTLVKLFYLRREQLKAGIKADEVAQKRYDISQQRYLVAKVSITDLNIALQEKDQAKRQYLQALRDFWNTYFQIRALTLYDFEQNAKINY